MPDPSLPDRPLLTAWSALGLMAATGVAFAALFPLGQERESRALSGAPDMLALAYLDLALARSPEDSALRLRVAERRLAAGQFDRAREALAPLAGDDAPEPCLLRLELEYRAWSALAGSEDAPAALARLVATIEDTPHERLPLEAAERVAELSALAGQSVTRATILGRLARADLENDERLHAADAAWLEAGQPLAAAELRAERALALPDRDGAVHAALALRRALAVGHPEPALALFRELRPTFGDNPRVLELGLAALAGVDDVQALAVAEQLLALHPDDAALRQRVAELRTWTRTGEPSVVSRAPAVAPPPLRWDSREALEVDVRSAENGERVIERAALLERLGAPERALQLIDGALAQSLADERALWEQKASVQLRLGKTRAALGTLTQIDDRFGVTRSSLQRRAELLLALGELRPALQLLESAPGEAAPAEVRQLGAIGWELGDIDHVRTTYRAIVSSAEVTTDDVRRLWLIEREDGDATAAARAALAGFERLGEPELLKLGLFTAVEAGDEALVAIALDAADRRGDVLLGDPEAVRLRVSARQSRARQALIDAEPEQARAELDQSAALLAAASADAPERKDVYGELWKTQERQTLDLAVAARDRQLLARVYPDQAENLSARERVFVLHRLGRDEDAVNEAVSGIEGGDLAEHDSGALQSDADALGAEMPRQLGVLGGVVSMEDLVTARVGAALRQGWSGGRALSAQVELTHLGSEPSLGSPGPDELAAELGGRLGQSALALGIVARDGHTARPSLRFEQGLLDGTGLDLGLLVRVNERSFDSAPLRLLAVEDEVAVRAEIAFLEHYSANVRASAKLYSERDDRQVLGAGAALDAAVGRHFGLGELGTGSLRVAGYVAPRFEREALGPVPDGASWVGLGAQLARGQLGIAPVAGRRLSLLADVSAGWLLPLDELGWSGKLGLGISVLGGDQLSLQASASNVMSNSPGFSVYMLGADYAVSRW
jgi:hypothetical protein